MSRLVLPTGTKGLLLSRLPDPGQKGTPFVPDWRSRLGNRDNRDFPTETNQRFCSSVSLAKFGAIQIDPPPIRCSMTHRMHACKTGSGGDGDRWISCMQSIHRCLAPCTLIKRFCWIIRRFRLGNLASELSSLPLLSTQLGDRRRRLSGTLAWPATLSL